MRKHFMVSTFIIVSSILAAADIANAQRAYRFELDIPFEFILNGRTLSPGRYSVERINPEKPNVVMFKGLSHKTVLMVITQRVERENPSTYSSLEFRRRGNSFHLVQIWSLGEMNGNRIPLNIDEQQNSRARNDRTFVKLRAKP